jgi:predicted TIM-barrel fold metal-dependent hydrolase
MRASSALLLYIRCVMQGAFSDGPTGGHAMGFRGLKVHGDDAMPTREVCEAAKAFGVPVLVDVVGQTHVIEMFAPQYREVNFIIPHLGSVADDWRAHQQLIDQLPRHADVYADTSGVRRLDYIVQAIKRAGVHKILFGSDGPWLHPGLELQKIRLLHLPPDQEAMILGKNILRLISAEQNDASQTRRRLIPFATNNIDSSGAAELQ